MPSALLASPESLTRAERHARTADLLAEAHTAEPYDRQRAVDEVVRLNLEVARSVASRYFNRGIDDDDLVQVASLALTRAAQQFDVTRHKDFLSYAVPTMRGELKKYFRDHGWTIRPPRRIQESQARIATAEGELTQLLGRSPRPSEIAAHTGLPLADVEEALSADGCFFPTSLDKPAPHDSSPDERSLADFLTLPDPDTPAAEARLTLAPVVRRLRERDRRILFLRYFEDRTQQEIADELGVTQMQVSRLLARILRDLRDGIGGPAPTV